MTRIAVIGCGHWGPNHIRAFKALPGNQVVMAIDPDPARLARVAALFPDLRCEPHHRAALEAADIDAVVIATPTGSHAALVRDALRAGKHVLCEKPLCETGEEADRLTTLAASQHRILAVGHVFLFNGGIIRLREVASDPAFGKLHYLFATRTNLGPVRADVNAAYDLAAHDISIFNWIIGAEPTHVSATGAAILQPRIEDVVCLSLTYPSGVIGSIRASWLDPKKVRQITMVGSRRMAAWDDLDLTSPLAIYDKGATTIPETNDYGEFLRVSTWDGDVVLPRIQLEEPLRVQNRHFLDAVAGRVALLPDGHFAAGVVRVLQAAQLSLHRRGAPVEVSGSAASQRRVA